MKLIEKKENYEGASKYVLCRGDNVFTTNICALSNKAETSIRIVLTLRRMARTSLRRPFMRTQESRQMFY